MTKDVSIIGASTAGLLTAKMLAEQGLKVTVFEASDHLDPAHRTLIVTNHLSKTLGPVYQSVVVNVIHRFELFANGRIARISLRQPDIIIERSKLFHELATQAKNSGAEVLTGHRFLGLKPNGKRLSFNIGNNGNKHPIEEYTHILVGADGAFSKVAKSGGWPKQDTVPLIQAVVKLPEDMPSDTTRVWFLPEETPFFYWLIPHSPTHGVLGLIAEEDRRGQHRLERFIDRKKLEPIKYQSASIPIYKQWVPIHRKIGESDVYLVGDAAGHVKASTVGGVVTGFRGALSVVDCILNKKNNKNLKGLQRELDLHGVIRKTLQGFTQTDYVKLFDMLNPAVMRSLASFNRDETVRLLINLFLNQPQFLLLGLRTFLKTNPLFAKGP